ncbi:MAG: molybdenum cofactor biosynthesis protein MoaE, partial [Betaproteobacteria bacterium]|nr:molybdenum cofactor biosynthesis protein MoaE [Betaproteobacteria bacterium]
MAERDRIAVQTAAFDVGAETARLAALDRGIGAIASFVG